MLQRFLPLAFASSLTTTTTSLVPRTYSSPFCSSALLPLCDRPHVDRPNRRRCTTPFVITCASSLDSSSSSSSPSPSSFGTLRVLRDEVIKTHSNVPADGRNGGGRTVSVTLKTEDLGGRRRRISGCITIPSSAARVWQVLTAYEKMDQFLPNVITSAVQRPRVGKKGAIMLDQIGLISRKLGLKTRLLMRVYEDADHLRLRLEQIEGRDFDVMDATYCITEENKEEEDKQRASGGVVLDYSVIAVPFRLYPMSLVENKVAREVPKMLAAIRDEAVLGKYVPL